VQYYEIAMIAKSQTENESAGWRMAIPSGLLKTNY